MPLNTTITWTYIEIALYAVLAAVASILFSVESRTMYLIFYDTNANKLAAMQESNPAGDTKLHGTPESVACNPPLSELPPIPNTECTECDTKCSECNTRSPPSVSTEIDIRASTTITIRGSPSTTIAIQSDNTRGTGAKPSPIETPAPSKAMWRLQVLTLLMFAFYIACGISAVLFKLGVGAFADCAPCGVQGSFYTAAKVSMYFIFIYRLYAIYSNSIFQFRAWTLVLLGVICIVFWSIMAVANAATVTTVLVQFGDETYCGCQPMMVLAAGVLLFDTVISFLCCWLFIRPLRVLNLLEGGRDQELYETVVKCTILTFVAVLSTILFMIVIGLLYLTGLTALDATINCVCVFLFNAKYDALYKVLCCGPRKCCCVKKN